MLGVFAGSKTNLRKETQLDGIAQAKAAGIYKGRPPSIDPCPYSEIQEIQEFFQHSEF
jgi:DNA invertase Pin-like site-specific DNA recombinase